MPLPQIGTIGCIPRAVIDIWAAKPENAVLKVENVLFPDAVSQTIDQNRNVLLFQPDNSNVEVIDRNFICPNGWSANDNQDCVPPVQYVSSKERECPPANSPFKFGSSDKRVSESYLHCNIEWTTYPRGIMWSFQGALPLYLILQMTVPNQSDGQCLLSNPVYYFELPNKAESQQCFLDNIKFEACFQKPGFVALERINREQDARSNNFKLLANAMKSGKNIPDYQHRIRENADANKIRAEQLKKETDRLRQETEYQLKLVDASGLTLMKGVIDKKVSNGDVHKYLDSRSYDLTQEIQNNENQEGRLAKQWKLARRIHELEEEWIGRFHIFFWILLIILVGICIYIFRQKHTNF